MSEIFTFHSDCVPIMNKLNDKSIDLIITDPPYGVNFKSKNPYDVSLWYIKNNVNLWCKEWFRLLKDSCFIALFVGHRNLNLWMNALNSAGFHFINILSTRGFNNGNNRTEYNFQFVTQFVLIYAKSVKKGNTYRPRSLNKVDFFKTSETWLNDYRNKNPKEYTYVYPNFIPSTVCYSTETIDEYHPNQKSLKLVKFLVEVMSDKKELVLDCFMGSGTTGVACKHTDRNFIGIEQNEEMFNIAKKRIENEPIESTLITRDMYNVGYDSKSYRKKIKLKSKHKYKDGKLF